MKELQTRRQQSTLFLGKQGSVTPRDLIKWGNRQPQTPMEVAEEGYMLLGELSGSGLCYLFHIPSHILSHTLILYTSSHSHLRIHTLTHTHSSHTYSHTYSHSPSHTHLRIHTLTHPSRHHLYSTPTGEKLRSGEEKRVVMEVLVSVCRVVLQPDHLYAITPTPTPTTTTFTTTSHHHHDDKDVLGGKTAGGGESTHPHPHPHRLGEISELQSLQDDLRNGRVGVEGVQGIALTASIARMWKLSGRAIAHNEPVPPLHPHSKHTQP